MGSMFDSASACYGCRMVEGRRMETLAKQLFELSCCDGSLPVLVQVTGLLTRDRSDRTCWENAAVGPSNTAM